MNYFEKLHELLRAQALQIRTTSIAENRQFIGMLKQAAEQAAGKSFSDETWNSLLKRGIAQGSYFLCVCEVENLIDLAKEITKSDAPARIIRVLQDVRLISDLKEHPSDQELRDSKYRFSLEPLVNPEDSNVGADGFSIWKGTFLIEKEDYGWGKVINLVPVDPDNFQECGIDGGFFGVPENDDILQKLEDAGIVKRIF